MATTLQDRLRGAAQTFSDHPPTFGLLFEAADTLDALQHDLAEARRIAGRHSTELGHLRKLHVPDGFRSALTDKGEPAAFIPTGPAELVPPAERSSTMARIERWKKRQPTTLGAETYDFTPEQEAEAAEQAERFQGLDDSDRD